MATIPAPRSVAHLARRLAAAGGRHPVLAVFTAALAVRLAFVAGTLLLTDGAVIPDETQYLYIGELASRGWLNAGVWNGYGLSMFHQTAGLMVPLTFLFEIFWPWRLFPLLFVTLAGALTSALAAYVGLTAGGRRAALIAGLLVALVPSQVLWSSVVLREGPIWLCLAAAAVVVTLALRTDSLWRLLGLGAAASFLVWWLCYLRYQTAVPLAWALPVVALAASPRRRVIVPAGAFVICLLAPAGELGIAGIDLVRVAVPALGSRRTELSLNADSAFVPTTILPRTTDTTRPTGGGPEGGRPEVAITTTTLPPVTVPTVTNSNTGALYVVDNSAGANLRALPRGTVAVMLRPFPWERSQGLGLLFARLENIWWYALYVLAALGAWFGRRLRHIVVFPLIMILMITGIAALTQGNLGTAFRHRGQLVWALGILAGIGVNGLIERWTAWRTTAAVESAAPEPMLEPQLVTDR
jgi:hypothetical protein